jgi:D-alanine-D-alanine ligase
VGLQFVERVSDWSQALAEAMRHGSRILMEEKVSGTECTVGILGDEALPILEVQVKAGVYDYQTKYTPGTTDYFCPARFDAEVTKRVQAAALAAFRAIGGRDYSRVDVIVRPTGEPMVLEVNTLPGMTNSSSLPKVAAAAGITYPALCQRMVELALKRKAKKLKS